MANLYDDFYQVIPVDTDRCREGNGITPKG